MWSIECSSSPVCGGRLAAWSGLSPSGASGYEDLPLPRACPRREPLATTLEHIPTLFSCFDLNPSNIANVRLQKLQRRGLGGNFQILEITVRVIFLARLLTAKQTENKYVRQSAVLSRAFSTKVLLLAGRSPGCSC